MPLILSNAHPAGQQGQSEQSPQSIEKQNIYGRRVPAWNKRLVQFVCYSVGDRKQPCQRTHAQPVAQSAPVAPGEDPVAEHVPAFLDKGIRPGEIREGAGRLG